jgi:DNA invertase Pin-like site-specific DNA recombinase
MKAAIYLRQSVDKNDDQLSIMRQRQDCLKLCDQNGWQPVEYVDNDTSASSGKRMRYEAMLSDIESGAIGAVVAWHLDRLHRRPLELEHFITLAEAKGIKLATVTGDVDLSTDQGQFIARIMGAVARVEVDRKSARQKRAMLQLAESGKPNPTARAFGYVEDWSKVDEHEAAAIREGYAMILAGSSLYSVANQWNTAGIRSSRGHEWSGKSVRQALLNPRYAGLRAYRGVVLDGVKASWPAIVTEDVWRSTVAILTNPQRQPGRAARKHLLSGIALCGNCNAPLGSGIKRKTEGSVYVCRECHKISRATDLIDPPVIELALAFLASPDAAELLVDRKRADIAELRQQERALLEQIDNLAVDYAEGRLTGRQVQIATERLETRLVGIQSGMRDANKARVFDGLVGAKNVRKVWDGLSLERRRAVLSTLFEVTVKRIGSGRRAFNAEDHIGIRWLTGEE